jgi:hypothetical protein
MHYCFFYLLRVGNFLISLCGTKKPRKENAEINFSSFPLRYYFALLCVIIFKLLSGSSM